MNLPNKITVLRILLIPIFMFIMLVPDWGTFDFWGMSLEISHFIATLIFILASVTDWVDGYIARKNNLVTNLGKFLDPLADKLLVGTALIVLVDLHLASTWITAAIIAREFAVTGMRLVLAGEGEVVAAAMLGKIKTWVQIVAVCICLLNNVPFEAIHLPMDQISMYVALIFTLWSGWDVFWVNRQAFLNSK
ncbi:MAG: CDP-diacylglycerol--glycerol-3-phosphate 3-phosphatidyltransferase [Bacillales bacterium]|jgi:CDP-diacylglycerol--glycerol-3-phosphate 3-phosphatidyltransferase|nr:CDP-diacylglycerol--glycerol-3-phosphate 3-phosphatidyltransferase [Bacillales bacterium]